MLCGLEHPSAAMPSYDPAIIEKFAADLYSRAASIVFTYTLAGVIIGLLPALSPEVRGSVWHLAIGVSLFGFLGYHIGSTRAFRMRLEAQTALCQVAIERNTRPINGAS